MLRRTYYLPKILPFTDEKREEIIGLLRGNNSSEIKANSKFALEIIYSDGKLRIVHRTPEFPINPEYEIQVEGHAEEILGEVEKIIGL